MKIAITTDGEELHNKVDQRFGRCPYFLIVNVNGTEVGTFEAVKNLGNEQGHGAGIRAVEELGELEVEAVITGQLGPNATKVLEGLNIKAYNASGVITDVLVDFVENKLEIISEISEPHSKEVTEEKEDSDLDIKTNSERIFFPLLNDDGLNSEISQHFGHAPFFGLYIVDKKEFKIIKNDLNHTDPNKSPIDQIQEAVNPTTIFAKGIGGRAINIIKEKGLGLKTGEYNTVAEVVDNLEKLDDQTQDCGHKH